MYSPSYSAQSININEKVEIRLDDVCVVDPDEEKIAGKVMLTTCIWLRDEEGALVLNLDSLDQKTMWLRALAPWVSGQPGLTSKGAKLKKISLASGLRSVLNTSPIPPTSVHSGVSENTGKMFSSSSEQLDQVI